MRRKYFTDRERIFFDARRAVREGKIVIVYYDGHRREVANAFAVRDGSYMVETIAGWTADWTDLRSFTTISDAIAELNKAV